MVTKKTAANGTIYTTLSRIEKEISLLKRSFLKLNESEIASIHPVSLRGIWHGVKIKEEDIAEAKKSLFWSTQRK